MTDTTATERAIAELRAECATNGQGHFANITKSDGRLILAALAAQPSAGAQPVAYQRRKPATKGGHYETEEEWIDCHPDDLEHYRSMGQEIRALGVIATPAQPDTGDVAALREAVAWRYRSGSAEEHWKLSLTPVYVDPKWGVEIQPLYANPAQPETALREALEGMCKIIRSAGVRQLSRGVELGPVSWAIKMNDALERSDRILAALSKPNAPENAS